MITVILQALINCLVGLLLGIQVADVHSTILALRHPWVQEVGDESLGLGNISGWCQRHLGAAWPVVKAPFLVFVPMLWTPVPDQIQVPIIGLLILANSYFFQITKQNYHNAYAPPPVGWRPESPTPSRRTP